MKFCEDFYKFGDVSKFGAPNNNKVLMFKGVVETFTGCCVVLLKMWLLCF